MPALIPNPFLEGQENDLSPVVLIYNKKFKGIDMKYIGQLINYYKKTNSPELKNVLVELIGEDLFNLIVQEYIYDIHPETKKLNQFSTLPDGKVAVEMRKALEIITENKEKIKKAVI